MLRLDYGENVANGNSSLLNTMEEAASTEISLKTCKQARVSATMWSEQTSPPLKE
jgi:hypothetical protein